MSDLSALTNSGADDIKEYTFALNLLSVAVSNDWYEQIKQKHGSFFNSVTTVATAKEGLLLFDTLAPDILLVSSQLPDMDCLDFLRSLTEHSKTPPSLLFSDSISIDFITASLNLGAARFLPSTANSYQILDAIGVMARDVFAKRTLNTLVNQEMELLRYRTRYHSQQQEMALRKEQHLLRNDLPGGVVTVHNGENEVNWCVGIIHTPKDIMCGDAYMIRQLESGDLLLFLVDAMGSGLSASLTAVSATSCINFLVDLYERENRFDFHRLVDCFLVHCRTILLDEEVISFGFIQIRQSSSEAVSAFFGLPPVQIRMNNHKVASVRGVNPPVTNMTNIWHPQFIDLLTLDGIVMHTDGLSDAEIETGKLYGEILPLEIKETFFASELLERFKKRFKNCDDDLTSIVLSCFLPRNSFYSETILDPSSIKISAVLSNFEDAIKAFNFEKAWCDPLVFAVSEAMINSFEHGCLHLGGVKKQQLLAEDQYDDFFNKTAINESITISACFVQLGIRNAIVITINDSGIGFNLKEILYKNISSLNFQGRGKTIIRSMVDQVCYNREGNCISIFKYLPEDYNCGNNQ